jgi:hypothetical protein
MKTIHILPLILVASLGAAELKPQMLGSWKSSRELTKIEMEQSKTLTAVQKAAVINVFGKLDLIIHDGIIITRFEGKLDTGRYELKDNGDDTGVLTSTDEKGTVSIEKVKIVDGKLMILTDNVDFYEVFVRVKE